MKKLLYTIAGFIAGATLLATTAVYAAPFLVGVGGTGTTTPSGILYGDNGASTHLNTVTIGTGLTFTGGTLTASGGTGGGLGTTTPWTQGQLAWVVSNSTVSSVATTTLAGTGVITVSNAPKVIGATPSVVSLTGGTNGQVLGWLSGVPTWTASSSVAAGTNITISTSGAVTTVNCPSCNTTASNVTSVSNADGTLTISPTTGVVVASLALTHANTWTGLQQFNNATSTLFTVSGTEWNIPLATPAGAFLAVNAQGKVIATSTPTGTNFWTLNGSNIYNNNAGNVGVGTTTPWGKLAIVNQAAVTIASSSVWTGPGTFTYTAPAGDFMVVQSWGAGGGGGGGSFSNNFGGAGGGSGAYVKQTIAAQSGTIYLGQGGQGGISNGGGTGGAGYKTGDAGVGAFGQGGGGGGGGSSAFTSSTTATTIIASGGGGGSFYDGGSHFIPGGGGATASGGTGGAGPSGSNGGGGGAGTNASGVTGGTGGSTPTFAGTDAGGINNGNFGGCVGTGGSGAPGASGLGVASAGIPSCFASPTDGGNGSGGAAGSAAGSGANGANGALGEGGGGSGGANNTSTVGNGGIPAAGGGGAGHATAGTGGAGMVIITVYSYTNKAPALNIQQFNGTATTTSLYVDYTSNVAIGTTTSLTGSVFTIANDSAFGDSVIFTIKALIGGIWYLAQQIDQYGHLLTGGPSPTANSCSGFTIVGDDRTGTVTYTSGTTCSVTFAHAYAAAPVCSVTPQSAASTVQVAPSTTGFAATFGSAQTSFGYICQQHQ